jgi:hypothetical protein
VINLSIDFTKNYQFITIPSNQGQADEQVNFLSRGSGYTLFLTSSEAVLVLKQQSAVSGQNSRLRTPVPSPHRTLCPTTTMSGRCLLLTSLPPFAT